MYVSSKHSFYKSLFVTLYHAEHVKCTGYWQGRVFTTTWRQILRRKKDVSFCQLRVSLHSVRTFLLDLLRHQELIPFDGGGIVAPDDPHGILELVGYFRWGRKQIDSMKLSRSQTGCFSKEALRFLQLFEIKLWL